MCFCLLEFLSEFVYECALFKVSNIFFFLVPPMMIMLFASYSKRVANGITFLWILLVIIGIGSVYFHATLSLV